MKRFILVLCIAARLAACSKTDDRPMPYEPRVVELDSSTHRQESAHRDIDTVDLSSLLKIKQLTGDSSVFLRIDPSGVGVIAYSESGQSLDTFRLADVSGFPGGIEQLTHRLAKLVVRLKGGNQRETTHILGVMSGRFRSTLSIRTLYATPTYALRYGDDYDNYSVKVSPSKSATTLRLHEKFRSRSNAGNEAWAAQTTVYWDSLRMIYRNDSIDATGARIENPNNHRDTISVSGIYPSVRMRDNDYINIENQWYFYSKGDALLQSVQW
jgi:hypothetical protein